MLELVRKRKLKYMKLGTVVIYNAPSIARHDLLNLGVRVMLRRAIIKKSINGLGVLGAGSFAFGTHAWSRGLPALISHESQRPLALWGTMVSEVQSGQAIIWSRSDRASQMTVKWSLDPDF